MRYLFLSILIVTGCNHMKRVQLPEQGTTRDLPRSITIEPDLRPECPITVEVDPEMDIMTEWDNTKAAAFFTLRTTCTVELLGAEQILFYHGAGELAPHIGGSFSVFDLANNGLLRQGNLMLGKKGPGTTVAFGQLWEEFLLVAETPGTTVKPGAHKITVWPRDTTGEEKPGPTGNLSVGDKVFVTLTGIYYRFPEDSHGEINQGEVKVRGKGHTIRNAEVNLTGSILTVPAK